MKILQMATRKIKYFRKVFFLNSLIALLLINFSAASQVNLKCYTDILTHDTTCITNEMPLNFKNGDPWVIGAPQSFCHFTKLKDSITLIMATAATGLYFDTLSVKKVAFIFNDNTRDEVDYKTMLVQGTQFRELVGIGHKLKKDLQTKDLKQIFFAIKGKNYIIPVHPDQKNALKKLLNNYGKSV